MSLVHALTATRDVARDHDGEVWRRLETRLDGLLNVLHDDDPDHRVGQELRLDRQQLDAGRSDEVMAALLPLGEDPTTARAQTALERLDLLDGGEGRDDRDDRPQQPERDPALTDDGW
ncbi:MAG: hypothetical protein WEB09_05160 [Nitriliruptor sp.]